MGVVERVGEVGVLGEPALELDGELAHSVRDGSLHRAFLRFLSDWAGLRDRLRSSGVSTSTARESGAPSF